MSGSDADRGEMAEFSVPGRDGPELDEQLLDAILTGQQLSPDAPGQAAVLAEMLASLAGPADYGPLAGEDAARSAFARAAARPATGRPGPAPRRSGRRPGPLTMRLAAVLAAIAAGLSAAAAAYAGALPGPVQDLAHVAIGAPLPRAPGASGRHQPGAVRPGRPSAPHAGAAPPPVTGSGTAGHRERPAGRATNTPAAGARGHSKLPRRKAGGRDRKRARAGSANSKKKHHKNKHRARNKRHRKSAG